MDEGSTFADGLRACIPRLRRYAGSLTRDAHRVDDLVQDTLARALAKEPLFQPGTDLRAWLFAIMYNQHVNNHRRRQREASDVMGGGQDEAVELLPARDATGVDRLLIRDLKAALMKLPPDQRRTILMIGYDGMSYEEAAELEQVPVGTVRSRLSRGRAVLRSLMEGDEGVDMQEDADLLAWARRST